MNKFNYGLVFIMVALASCQDSQVTKGNYYSYLQKIGNYERLEPAFFLEASGRYNENLWGDEIVLSLEINNSAKVASFKDVVLEVIYYSKTNSIMEVKNYVVYEAFPPQKTIKTELRIENKKEVEKIGWSVIDAMIN